MKPNWKLLDRTRIYLGMTKVKLAEKAGLPITPISKALNGLNSHPPTILAIAKALGLKIEDVWKD